MSQASVTQVSSMNHPLVARITRMRGRVRLVVALFGFGVLLASAVGGIVLLMLADYLVHLGPAVRLVLLLAWLAGVAVLAWRVLISPLSTLLTDQFLASRVENLHKDLADELISAVHFIHAGTIRTNALAARHVDAAAAKTQSIRFEEAVDFRRSSKALGIALLVILATTLVFALNPGWTRIAFSRWFSSSPVAWPHSTEVRFAWSTTDGKPPGVIPIGEQFVVRAKVIKGGYADQHVYLTTWADNKSSDEAVMTYQPAMSTANEFVYEKTVNPDGDHTFSMQVSAGDDREEPSVTVRLAPRPLIGELTASISPPKYVRDIKDPSKPAPPVMVDLLSQAGRAVEGSSIALRVKSSKPFMLDARGLPEVRLLDQTRDVDLVMGMSRQLLDADTALVTFPAAKTLQARLSVRDTDGFDNRSGGTLAVEVVPDGLPSVVITQPRGMAERLPTGTVNVEISGTDDWGLDGLKLVADKYDAKPGDAAVFESKLEWADRTMDSAAGNVMGHAVYTWDLATATGPDGSPLNLQPGARLSFYAMVQDNYQVDGPPAVRHPWVKSAPLTLQILSEQDLTNLFRKELDEVKGQIKPLKEGQEKTQAQLDVIQKAAAASGVTTAQQKQQLAQLTQQQHEELSTAEAIQKRVEGIEENIKQNKMADTDLGKLATTVAQGMKDVGDNNMTKALSELNKAHDAAGNKDPKDGAKQDDQSREQAKQAADSAQSASKQQGEAITKMNDMLAQLGQTGDLQAALSEAKAIKEAQDKIDAATDKHAEKNAGKDLDQLSKDAKAGLDKLTQDQKDLSQKTRDLIDQMNKSAQQMQQKDPAAAQSMAKAAQAGQKSDVPGAQSQASQNLSKNQTSDASNNQAQAQQGLQQMIDELSKADKRELEQLQRQLAKLLEEVQALKISEEGINKDTIAASEKAAAAPMAKLGDRQGTLQMNTIVVQKEAENTRDAQKAAADIHDAGDHMGTATASLYASKQPSSLDPETQAIASLQAAIEKLQKQKNDVDDKLKDKDLAEFIQQYETIKTGQIGIKKISDTADTDRLASDDKEISRQDEHALLSQVAPQGDLIDQVGKLSTDDKLKDYDVIVWMNSQITQAMGASKDDLSKAHTGTQLASEQQTALDRIDDVIQALKEEKDKKKFDSGGGGGGGGGGGKQPLIPPLAQMKLIRAMQNVVNQETATNDKARQAAVSEADKARLEAESQKIGKTQSDLSNITKKIIDQSQGGGQTK